MLARKPGIYKTKIYNLVGMTGRTLRDTWWLKGCHSKNNTTKNSSNQTWFDWRECQVHRKKTPLPGGVLCWLGSKSRTRRKRTPRHKTPRSQTVSLLCHKTVRSQTEVGTEPATRGALQSHKTSRSQTGSLRVEGSEGEGTYILFDIFWGRTSIFYFFIFTFIFNFLFESRVFIENW